jgi:hypothetical protein
VSQEPLHRGGNPSISGFHPGGVNLDSPARPPGTLPPSRDSVVDEYTNCLVILALCIGVLMGVSLAAFAVAMDPQDLMRPPIDGIGNREGQVVWTSVGILFAFACIFGMWWHVRSVRLKRQNEVHIYPPHLEKHLPKPPSRLDQYN